MLEDVGNTITGAIADVLRDDVVPGVFLHVNIGVHLRVHYYCSFEFKYLKTRAGFPATIAFAGTSFVTTLPAPTSAFSPIVTFARIVAPDPIEAPLRTTVRSTCLLYTSP